MNSKPFSEFLLISFVLLIFCACSSEPETGPDKVRWDRDVCERCAMAISDHNFSAQVRGGPTGSKTKLHKFDDIGCAVIWLDEQSWKNDARTEIWVTDFRNGQWIDAQKAWYVTGQTTPMDYQLGATSDRQAGSLNYVQAKQHIHEVEQRFNAHNGQPLNIGPSK